MIIRVQPKHVAKVFKCTNCARPLLLLLVSAVPSLSAGEFRRPVWETDKYKSLNHT